MAVQIVWDAGENSREASRSIENGDTARALGAGRIGTRVEALGCEKNSATAPRYRSDRWTSR